MNGVNEIRAAFLDFFRKNGHEIVPSSPLVPRNDPTLMFTNAGMVQFKNLFTGVEKRPYTRASTAQKCVRAGGKHNDLDNVGYTARHHTFFEMLGNFSFGDYFKPLAIELAWKLITEVFDLPKDRLLVTVYHDDDEAYDLWKKIAGFPDSKIIRIATSDNFWAMGDTGPCGPCSEIFYDQGEKLFGGPPGSADEDGDRFLEFWNLVFMQFEQRGPGDRIALPKPSIDTGMGLERIAALLQGVTSNYDIDLMRALILAVAQATGVDPDGPMRASHRVIADHLRASSFLIADGVLPSNEGRGYVLRRIMRRAMRHAQLLGAQEPLLWRLVPALTREMGQAYPELLRAEALIVETLRLEETRFRATLARGLTILEDETRHLSEGGVLSGEVAFKLYDTYGFPLDLTQDALRAKSLGVDMEGFEKAMARQRAEARKAWSGSGEAATDTHWFALREQLGATDFLGYDTEKAEALIQAILQDGKEVLRLEAGQSGAIVLNQTPFYGESGGQVGDTGLIIAPGMRFKVENTHKKLGDLFIHEGIVEEGAVVPGLEVRTLVDHSRRTAVRANHSATHLLHEALRQVLGDHIAQKGSLVAPDRLRFDFSHPKPVTPEEWTQIEDIANSVILENAPVTTKLMSIEDAMGSGARALFGEKYGDEVRVVSMGYDEDKADDSTDGRIAPPFSVELCGGTHVARTGDIGLLTIISESAVAAGVRRIEAKTGSSARHHLNTQASLLHSLAAQLKSPEDEASKRLSALIEERRKLDRELSEARKKLAMGGGSSNGADSPLREIGGIKFFRRAVTGVEMKDLKSLADEAKQTIGSGIVAIVGVGSDNKASVVVGVTDDLIDRFDAVALVRLAAGKLGGKGGGGRKDLAQAGGPDGEAAEAALTAIEESLGSSLPTP
ncbi:alanine--tRNA ligase [Beijerinckia indica]|uniref:Alanine--tRNA ligase n=1 Tax=Beijerinckia indica subsp. indica (strain ATCC 9039 / DSM 1715 / NCIMB 8712) TaxID=395963 RepID=SYA_BEII9|nr:alanine--tRNA ligase [Beijerinckia indica]B2IHX3.2 RecName: Full=Alanine--tRNA ligase; AltName: Full=Alanyl-tRNA synthetase; Short=AlaRS [Beijerinckia indica subsp. indica ATCC 9039]